MRSRPHLCSTADLLLGLFLFILSTQAVHAAAPIFVKPSATFAQAAYTLTTHTVGVGDVLVSPEQATYADGDVVKLTALPDVNYTFEGFSGDVDDNCIEDPHYPVCPVTMDSSKEITLTFQIKPYALNIATNGDGTVDKATGSWIRHAEYFEK
jgi:hypothetical protein